jgi:hypothetical protein
MVAVKAHFDGKQIVLHEELQGVAPQEVLVVLGDLRPPKGQPKPSIFDVIGKAPVKRTAEDIDRQIREERESWGDR